VSTVIEKLKASRIDWQESKESEFVFHTDFLNHLVRLRLNDFPDESLCTLIFDGVETDLEEFPECWSLPRHRNQP